MQMDGWPRKKEKRGWSGRRSGCSVVWEPQRNCACHSVHQSRLGPLGEAGYLQHMTTRSQRHTLLLGYYKASPLKAYLPLAIYFVRSIQGKFAHFKEFIAPEVKSKRKKRGDDLLSNIDSKIPPAPRKLEQWVHWGSFHLSLPAECGWNRRRLSLKGDQWTEWGRDLSKAYQAWNYHIFQIHFSLPEQKLPPLKTRLYETISCDSLSSGEAELPVVFPWTNQEISWGDKVIMKKIHLFPSSFSLCTYMTLGNLAWGWTFF